MWIERASLFSRARACPRVEVATELKKESPKHPNLDVLSFIAIPPLLGLSFTLALIWLCQGKERHSLSSSSSWFVLCANLDVAFLLCDWLE